VPGIKTFVDGVPLYASELNDYLMRQTVMRFATTTALLNAIPVGVRETGMLAWVDATSTLYLFTGGFWIPLDSPIQAFDPIFTAGGTNVTVGNAVVGSSWRYSGGLVKWNFRFVVGSTSNMQSGNYALSLPIAARQEYDRHYLGAATFWDNNVTTMFHRAACTLGTITSIGIVDSNGTRMSTTSPATVINGDEFSVSLFYPPSTGTYLS
jgi:hypothetical protein